MIEQRTKEWFNMRYGRITASEVKLIAAGIGSQTAKKYIKKKRWERRNNSPAKSYSNDAMKRGTMLEPEAVKAYEIDQLCVVQPAPFVIHQEYPFIGASPDGLVGESGLLEVKCPDETSAALHQWHIDDGYYARLYKHQVNLQLAVTGRQWCDVVSYYPVDGETEPLAIWRVERDEEAIEKLIQACVAAWEEVIK